MSRPIKNLVFLIVLLSAVVSIYAQPIVLMSRNAKMKDIQHAKVEVSIQEPAYRILGVHTWENEGKMELSWSKSADVEGFRYDAGMVVDGLSLTNAGAKGVIGVAFRDIRLLERISWTLYNTESSIDRRINLYVFALSETGSPTNILLYSAENVSCKSLEASLHDLCTPIETPRGCLIALSAADGLPLSLGMDNGKSAEWPVALKTRYYTMDYSAGKFLLMDGAGPDANLFIRCYGEKANHSNIEESYRVWRFEAGRENTPEEWTLLTPTPISGNVFEDAAYASLSMGVYRYAVDVDAKTETLAGISCPIYKDMFTAVDFRVKTNDETVIPEGADVILAGKSGLVELPNYTSTVSTDGTVVFASVMKGRYILKISWDGFESIETEVDLSREDIYSLGNYTIQEILDAPWSIVVNRESVPGTRQIRWNGNRCIVEDVEGHEDFLINSAGELGWSYIDGDLGIPYAINNCQFPNMNKPMAFIVFNPGRTSPALSNIPAAISHSGQKYFAAISNMPPNASSPSPANNDFIISPRLDFEYGFTFDFWAKTYQEAYPESFQVWYSTTGNSQKDFVHELTDGPVKAAAQWTNYTYKVPKEALYVAVNYVSEDKFIFMLDDLRFTEERSRSVARGFEVSLDGTVIDTVAKPEIYMKGLSAGIHKVAIRTLYLTKNSAPTELEFEVKDVSSSVKATVKDEAGNPLAHAKMILSGDFIYEGVTDKEGRIDIEKVQGNASYMAEITAEGYKPQKRMLELTDKALDLGEIIMQDMPVKPGTVFAAESSDAKSVQLTWRAPSEYMLFRKDDGAIAGGLGSNTGTENTIVGAVHTSPTELYSIQWMTATQGDNEINLFVLDLDANGMPVKKMLYEKRNVKNKGMQWNIEYLETPIRCPNGFMLGVSGTKNGNVGLGADSGKDSIWPFVPKTNYLISDYTDEEQAFNLLDQQIARNLLIRAEGSVGLYKGKASKAAMGYLVYREELNTERWVCLTKDPVSSTSFVDTAWKSLPKGYYRYAVRSVYTNGDSSEMAYSNNIGKNVRTSVSISVMTNNTFTDSAEVRLTSSAGETFKMLTDVSGVAVFQNLPAEIFNLKISKNGYADFEIYALDFSNEPFYKVGPYMLTAELPVPSGLRVEATGDWAIRDVYWNVMEGNDKNMMLFLLDDNNKAGFYLYELQVDGVRLGETAENHYRIGNLTAGKHTVGVRTKSGYSYSSLSEVSFTVVDPSVEIEQNGKLQVDIYPNPVTNGQFTVSCTGCQIRSVVVSDMSGREMSVQVSGSAEKKTVWAGTLKGMMLLRVETERGKICKKIMIL